MNPFVATFSIISSVVPFISVTEPVGIVNSPSVCGGLGDNRVTYNLSFSSFIAILVGLPSNSISFIISFVVPFITVTEPVGIVNSPSVCGGLGDNRVTYNLSFSSFIAILVGLPSNSISFIISFVVPFITVTEPVGIVNSPSVCGGLGDNRVTYNLSFSSFIAILVGLPSNSISFIISFVVPFITVTEPVGIVNSPSVCGGLGDNRVTYNLSFSSFIAILVGLPSNSISFIISFVVPFITVTEPVGIVNSPSVCGGLGDSRVTYNLSFSSFIAILVGLPSNSISFIISFVVPFIIDITSIISSCILIFLFT